MKSEIKIFFSQPQKPPPQIQPKKKDTVVDQIRAKVNEMKVKIEKIRFNVLHWFIE